MFTLFVGSEKHQFYSHAKVLSQSPVFERMCNGSFKESAEQHIELPDDDANVFGCMLEYLYSGVVHGFETPSQGSDAAVLADVYILAEKYQLNKLKELLITPMAVFLDSVEKECAGCFFDAALKIYHNTPDSDLIFQDFFKISVTQLLDDKVPGMEAHIKRCISDGGKLALDTFDAYYKHMSTKHEVEERVAEERAETKIALLREDFRNEQAKHQTEKMAAQRLAETKMAKLQKDYSDLQTNHKRLEMKLDVSNRTTALLKKDHRP